MADGLQKPGETPARPGEYEERGPRGGKVPSPRRYTIERGDDPVAANPETRPERSSGSDRRSP